MRSCINLERCQHIFGDSTGDERSWLSKTDLIYSEKVGSTTEIDKDNIIEAMAGHLLEDIRQMLEECKKKRDEEDMLAALASI